MSTEDKNGQQADTGDNLPDVEQELETQDETGAGAGNGQADRLTLLEQALELQTRKAQENLDLAQRTRADMENLRKRTSRDIENAHKYALERFVNELLPVLDSLELGIQASETTTDITGLREGMNLTLKKFCDSLEKAGVVTVNPASEKFNPEKHSAVSMVAAEGKEAGTVIAVLQKGYELNGRLVRPAMVVVSS